MNGCQAYMQLANISCLSDNTGPEVIKLFFHAQLN